MTLDGVKRTKKEPCTGEKSSLNTVTKMKIRSIWGTDCGKCGLPTRDLCVLGGLWLEGGGGLEWGKGFHNISYILLVA